MVVDSPDDEKAAVGRLTSFLEAARIPAQVDVLVRGERALFDVIRDASADAGIVFLGMKPPAPDQTPEDYSRYYEELLRQTDSLPATALVTANEKVDFRSIFGGR